MQGTFDIPMIRHHRAPEPPPIFSTFHYGRDIIRLSGKDRKFIKGQKYTLLSRRANLSQEGRQSLKALFKANKRLNKAYLLKEMFSQLWDYKPGSVGAAFFRAMEVGLEVAASQAVREVRPDGRGALGRDRVVLP